MTFEYIAQWAMLNDFEVLFYVDKPQPGSVRMKTIRFTYYDKYGRQKNRSFQDYDWNEVFRKVEYYFPKLVQELKHVKPEDLGIKTGAKG